jgi:hypothetical protein
LREYPLPQPALGRERIRKVVDLLATLKAASVVWHILLPNPDA